MVLGGLLSARGPVNRSLHVPAAIPLLRNRAETLPLDLISFGAIVPARFAANDNIPKTAREYARPRPISRLALRLVLITLLVAVFVVRLFSLLVLLSKTRADRTRPRPAWGQEAEGARLLSYRTVSVGHLEREGAPRFMDRVRARPVSGRQKDRMLKEPVRIPCDLLIDG